MKNKLKILLMGVIGIFLFTTCKKDPQLPMPKLQLAVIPLITKDKTKDQNVSIYNLPGFNGSVIVNTYFKDLPKSMDLMVCMNDSIVNTAVLKANITSFPTTVDFTLPTLVGLIPGLDSLNQLQLGNYFKFYVDITLPDGTVVKGNDTLYASSNSAVKNLPGSSLSVIYTVACPLDPALTVGSYHAVSSDFGVDGNITITADASDPNKLYVTGLETIDGDVEDKGPLVMHLDPLTYEVIADKTVLASFAGPYHNIAYGGKGTYNTCTGNYDMTFTITVTEGSFGDNTYTFTRN
jgi:hypothetical protein